MKIQLLLVSVAVVVNCDLPPGFRLIQPVPNPSIVVKPPTFPVDPKPIDPPQDRSGYLSWLTIPAINENWKKENPSAVWALIPFQIKHISINVFDPLTPKIEHTMVIEMVESECKIQSTPLNGEEQPYRDCRMKMDGKYPIYYIRVNSPLDQAARRETFSLVEIKKIGEETREIKTVGRQEDRRLGDQDIY